MGAAGDLGADQGRLGVEDIGVDLLQALPALIVVAVAGGGGKVVGPDAAALHGGEDLGLVVLRPAVNGPEAVLQPLQHLLPPPVDGGAEAHFFI